MNHIAPFSDRIPSPDTIVIRHSGRAYCPVCEKPVDLLSYEDAANLYRTDRRDIDLLAEDHRLHRVHNKFGWVMICSLSLFECFNVRETRPLELRLAAMSDLGSFIYEDSKA